MGRIGTQTILRLATIAEADGDDALARSLYTTGGRMGRGPGGSGFDAAEDPDAAHSRGLVRARGLAGAGADDPQVGDPAAATAAGAAEPPRRSPPDLDPTWPPRWGHMKAPFPWFGGKSRASSLIWERFGDAANYVEPFAGSLAVLLKRPHAPQTETVNDIDSFLANFWRSIRADPEAVARHSDWPVNESDLRARHLWLVRQAGFRDRMRSDPDFHDPKIAGWWAWGLSCWIAGGWCEAAARADAHVKDTIPCLSTSMGVHRKSIEVAVPSKMPSVAIMGLHCKMPNLGGGNTGVQRQMEESGPRGLIAYFESLADRLRRVRVCCGQWDRVLGPSVTTKFGTTAILLDPPYSDKAERAGGVYAHDDLQVAHAVRGWAIANGDNPQLRIALCGYSSEHVLPDGWSTVAWKAGGGYGGQRKDGGNHNGENERIWFSPHCLKPDRSAQGKQATIFDASVDRADTPTAT